jgi:Spy/CpxP family protein refolding chaperone
MQISRRTRGAVAGLALAAGALFAMQATARPGGGRPGECGGGHGMGIERLERKVDRLGLDEKTRASAYGVIDQARVEERSLRSELRAARERMKELLAVDAPDLAAVEAQSDAIGQLETALDKIRLRSLVAIRGLVTPEQWQQLQQRKHDHRGRRGDAPPQRS